MRRNIFIPKIPTILLVFLLLVFYGATAMESISDKQEGTSSPQKVTKLQDQIRMKVDEILQNFRRNMDAYYRRTRVAASPPKRAQPKIGDQIREKVHEILKAFRDNMNAYYRRTGNTKRIGIVDEEENPADIPTEREKLASIPSVSLSAATFPVDLSLPLIGGSWPGSTGAEKRKATEARLSIPGFPELESTKSIGTFSTNPTGKNKAEKKPDKFNILDGRTPSPQIRSTSHLVEAERVITLLPNLSRNLLPDQKSQLSERISGELNGLPQFRIPSMTTKIMSVLNTVTSLEGAMTALANVKSPKVLSRETLTEEGVKRRETVTRQESIVRIEENKIAYDTQRVMEKSGIASWIKAFPETTIESDIKVTVTKLYTGEIPNLGGAQDPLQPLIDRLKGTREPADVKTKLAEFESEKDGFKEVVKRGEESEKFTNDMESISSTLDMKFQPMIAKQNSQLVGLGQWNILSLLKFNNNQNVTEKDKFEQLKKSLGTGFVYIQFGSHPHVSFQMNMKVFSLRIQQKFSQTLSTVAQKMSKDWVKNPQPYQEEEYYTVKLGQTSAEKLQNFGNCLGEGKYELWSVPGDEKRGRYFFAISMEPGQPVISLTLTDNTDLSGSVDNYIDMARYLMSGSTDTYTPKTVRRINEANSKLDPSSSTDNSSK